MLGPYNAFTKHDYTRGNVAILEAAAAAAGFTIPAWLTAKEIEKLGGRIRDGETGQQIYYAGPSRRARDGDDEDEKPSRLHTGFVVFNIEQCTFDDGTYGHTSDLRRCFAHFDELSERERKFVKSLSQRSHSLTPRQRNWLDDIVARVGG
jgi:antirestriction protein ArdC